MFFPLLIFWGNLGHLDLGSGVPEENIAQGWNCVSSRWVDCLLIFIIGTNLLSYLHGEEMKSAVWRYISIDKKVTWEEEFTEWWEDEQMSRVQQCVLSDTFRKANRCLHFIHESVVPQEMGTWVSIPALGLASASVWQACHRGLGVHNCFFKLM